MTDASRPPPDPTIPSRSPEPFQFQAKLPPPIKRADDQRPGKSDREQQRQLAAMRHAIDRTGRNPSNPRRRRRLR